MTTYHTIKLHLYILWKRWQLMTPTDDCQFYAREEYRVKQMDTKYVLWTRYVFQAKRFHGREENFPILGRHNLPQFRMFKTLDKQ